MSRSGHVEGMRLAQKDIFGLLVELVSRGLRTALDRDVPSLLLDTSQLLAKERKLSRRNTEEGFPAEYAIVKDNWGGGLGTSRKGWEGMDSGAKDNE